MEPLLQPVSQEFGSLDLGFGANCAGTCIPPQVARQNSPGGNDGTASCCRRLRCHPSGEGTQTRARITRSLPTGGAGGSPLNRGIGLYLAEINSLNAFMVPPAHNTWPMLGWPTGDRIRSHRAECAAQHIGIRVLIARNRAMTFLRRPSPRHGRQPPFRAIPRSIVSG